VKNFKVTIAVVFVAALVAALAAESFAYPPFLAKSRKFGAKDCRFCHVELEGGAPWNERGQWLIKEKARRGADAVDVEWLAEYKPGKADDKKLPAEPAKPDEKKPAQQAASTPASAVAQELMKVERAWLDAYLKRDVAAMEQIESDDFTITHANGQVITKAQEIANLKREGAMDPSTSFDTEDTKVRVYGDTAILTGIFVFKSKNSFERSRYTDVYVKRNGRWQVVASHLTRLGAPAAPSSPASPSAPASPSIPKPPAGPSSPAAPSTPSAPSAPAAPSTPAAPAAPAASSFKVDPATFDAYLGDYETPFGVLSITKEGDRLFGQPGGDSKQELIAESMDNFNVPGVGAKVKFVKDANGKVTHAVINIQGQDIQAKKIK
jgi:ketosteroid isomerase-like protein